MKTPLIIQTTVFAIAFLDGFLSLGFSDDIYTLFGIVFIGVLIWMWVIQSRLDKESNDQNRA